MLQGSDQVWCVSKGETAGRGSCSRFCLAEREVYRVVDVDDGSRCAHTGLPFNICTAVPQAGRELVQIIHCNVARCAVLTTQGAPAAAASVNFRGDHDGWFCKRGYLRRPRRRCRQCRWRHSLPPLDRHVDD